MNEIEDNAVTLILSGRYDQHSFGYRNISKSQERYRLLDDVQPQILYSGSIELLPGGRITDLILLLLCLLVGLELICTERIIGTMALIKPTFRGSYPLMTTKILALILAMVCVLGLAGCSNRSMNYIIRNEPNITGIVKETNENAILIKNENGEYWVSLNVENKDSMTSFNVGEEVVVYYDGNIKEIILSSSIEIEHQINNVYAITLKTPTDRTENDKS